MSDLFDSIRDLVADARVLAAKSRALRAASSADREDAIRMRAYSRALRQQQNTAFAELSRGGGVQAVS